MPLAFTAAGLVTSNLSFAQAAQSAITASLVFQFIVAFPLDPERLRCRPRLVSLAQERAEEPPLLALVAGRTAAEPPPQRCGGQLLLARAARGFPRRLARNLRRDALRLEPPRGEPGSVSLLDARSRPAARHLAVVHVSQLAP